MTLSWENTETYPAEFLQNRGKKKLISRSETVNGTSVLCVATWNEPAKKRPVHDRPYERSRIIQTTGGWPAE